MRKAIVLLAGVMFAASACTLIDERYAGVGIRTSPSDRYVYDDDDYQPSVDAYDAPYPYSYWHAYWPGTPSWRFGWYSWSPFFYLDPYFYLWSYSLYGYSYYSPWRYYGSYYGYGGQYTPRRIDRTVVSKDSLQRLGSGDGTVRRIRRTPSSGSSAAQIRRPTAARSSSSSRSGTIRSSGSSRSGGSSVSSSGSRSASSSRSGGSSGGGRTAGSGSIRKK
ncbi:MAG: hypothetical protein FJY82_09835 [Candidatus Aminicenantes bacterium]|nr:hypothetical protein [Candidatus Aminicenantes bacterium]